MIHDGPGASSPDPGGVEGQILFDSFLEGFPGPAFIRDSRSRYMMINTALKDLFPSVDLCFREPSEIYPPRNVDILRKMDAEVLDRGYVRRERHIGERCFDVHYFRIEGSNGEPMVAGVGFPVPDHRSTEDRGESTYRAVYENTGTAMAIVDPEGILESVNANAELITGYSRDEIIGRMHWSEFVHPEDRDMVADRRRARMEGERSGGQDYEFRLITRDDEIRHVKVHTGTIPGTRKGIISMADISGLVRSRRELNRSLEKTQAILEAIPDLMLVLTRDGKYRDFYARDESMMVIPPEELPSRTVFDIGLPGNTVEELIGTIERTIDTGMVNQFEYQLQLPDGLHHYEAGMAPFEQDSVLVLCRDVTARKTAEAEQRKLEAQVRHVQKLESLGVLAGGIAHDFNNILMAVTGNIYLARKAVSAGEDPEKFMASVETAAERASDLAGQMLSYSGKADFEMGYIDLNSVAEDLAALLSATVSKKAVIRFDLQPELPEVLADAAQVSQVVMNLITNASEALEGKPGNIVISSGCSRFNRRYLRKLHLTEELEPGTYVWLQVQDDGKGIESGIMNRIFDPFFTTKFTGRGLGLSAVLGIMRSHGGGLEVESVQGEGSRFRALFPAGEGASGGTAVSEASVSGIVDGAGTILFADDEPVIREIAATVLRKSGFEVITAHDGNEAIRLFSGDPSRFELAVLDLTMPGIDGDQVFREMRKLSGDIPVLISSGYHENEIVSRFAGEPPSGFLKKPYSPDALVSRICSLIQRTES